MVGNLNNSFCQLIPTLRFYYPKYFHKATAGLDISKSISSQKYLKKSNKYNVKCGTSLEDWNKSGWIENVDLMTGLCGIVDITKEEDATMMKDR